MSRAGRATAAYQLAYYIRSRTREVATVAFVGQRLVVFVEAMDDGSEVLLVGGAEHSISRRHRAEEVVVPQQVIGSIAAVDVRTIEEGRSRELLAADGPAAFVHVHIDPEWPAAGGLDGIGRHAWRGE